MFMTLNDGLTHSVRNGQWKINDNNIDGSVL